MLVWRELIYESLGLEKPSHSPDLGWRKAMPRYFFDIRDGHDFPDLQGSEFADLAAARIEAVRYAAEILKDMPGRFWNCEEWTMTVSNHNRKTLFTLKFLAESIPSATSTDNSIELPIGLAAEVIK
jgi:hypothetical protein